MRINIYVYIYYSNTTDGFFFLKINTFGYGEGSDGGQRSPPNENDISQLLPTNQKSQHFSSLPLRLLPHRLRDSPPQQMVVHGPRTFNAYAATAAAAVACRFFNLTRIRTLWAARHTTTTTTIRRGGRGRDEKGLLCVCACVTRFGW